MKQHKHQSLGFSMMSLVAAAIMSSVATIPTLCAMPSNSRNWWSKSKRANRGTHKQMARKATKGRK